MPMISETEWNALKAQRNLTLKVALRAIVSLANAALEDRRALTRGYEVRGSETLGACDHSAALQWDGLEWCQRCGAVRAGEAFDIPADTWVAPHVMHAELQEKRAIVARVEKLLGGLEERVVILARSDGSSDEACTEVEMVVALLRGALGGAT